MQPKISRLAHTVLSVRVDIAHSALSELAGGWSFDRASRRWASTGWPGEQDRMQEDATRVIGDDVPPFPSLLSFFHGIRGMGAKTSMSRASYQSGSSHIAAPWQRNLKGHLKTSSQPLPCSTRWHYPVDGRSDAHLGFCRHLCNPFITAAATSATRWVALRRQLMASS